MHVNPHSLYKIFYVELKKEGTGLKHSDQTSHFRYCQNQIIDQLSSLPGFEFTCNEVVAHLKLMPKFSYASVWET